MIFFYNIHVCEVMDSNTTELPPDIGNDPNGCTNVVFIHRHAVLKHSDLTNSIGCVAENNCAFTA